MKLTSSERKTHERARTAYSEAQRLLPGWRATARMLTGNPKIKVELHGGATSMTDGSTIMLKVPAALASMPEHDTSLCGFRDQYNVQECEACDTLEDINITLIHEISHIVFDTFESTSPDEQRLLLDNAIKVSAAGQAEGSSAAKIKRNIENAPQEIKRSYIGMAQLVSPYLPLLINAAEDIRVNSLMQKHRPGTQVMFDAQIKKVFRDGVEDYAGNHVHWRDTPPNAQAMIAVYCKVGGFDYTLACQPEIAEALDDSALDAICDEMRESTSIRDVYRLSIPLLENLRRLGFFLDESDEEDEDEDEENNEDPGEGLEGQSEQSAPGEDGQKSGKGDSDDLESNESDESSNSEADSNSGSKGDNQNNESSLDSSPVNKDDDLAEGEGPQEAEDSDNSNSSGNAESSNNRGNASADPGSDATSDGDEDRNEESVENLDEPPTDADSDDPDIDADDPHEAPTDAGNAPDSGDHGEGSNSPTDGSQDATETPQNDGKDTRDSGFDSSSTDMGEPSEVERLFAVFGQHEDVKVSPSGALEEAQFEEAVNIAVEQMKYFDSPSLTVEGVTEHVHEDGTGAWSQYGFAPQVTIPVSEGVMSTALQRLRILFTDNARGRTERNLRSGKVDARMLAKRVPVGDDRLFKKNRLPGRRDYFVLIGLDVSGSTSHALADGHRRIDLIKAAAGAKAELLSRLGVNFAMYAHSGDFDRVDIFPIKSSKERWGVKQQRALAELRPYSANLDGHTLEYYRKVIERRNETDRLLLYYTDGAMPAANYHEELEILQRNIKILDRQDIHLVGIGVETDSPKEHGLDTIILNGVEDIPTVVTELRKRLM